MTAGYAAAEVSLSGDAVMSVIGGDGYATTANGANDDLRFQSNVDVHFTMSGETDSGLSFGTKIDLDEAAATSDANEAIWLKGAFGTITMGDTDSAIDFVNAETQQGAILGDDFTTHAATLENFFDEATDNTIARYDYSVGALTLSGSVEIDANKTAATAHDVRTGTALTVTDVEAALSNDPSFSVGMKYNMPISGGSLTLGAGYQNTPDRISYVATSARTYVSGANDTTVDTYAAADTSVVGVSAALKLDSGLGLSATYADISNYSANNAVLTANDAGTASATTTGSLNDATQWGIGADYTVGDLTVGASYAEIDSDNNAEDQKSYALGASYSLGTGARVFGAMKSEEVGTAAATEKYQLGLAFAF